VPAVTWTEPVILIFPLLVPTTPRRTFLAALLSAMTRPAALFFLAAHGEMQWTTGDLMLVSASPMMAVIFGLFGAKIVYGFGREVATAREMGAYRLKTRLGSGGMGEVWSASHRMLARPAAVKLIRPEVLGAAGSDANAAVERFEREAQVTANLCSGHTVNLYDFGRAEDGTFYYVMELLDGLDLETLVTKYGPVPVERAVYLASQVCHSLDEAHAAGLVHRDIKPANVFTCRHGRDLDFIKVLDFGLVKATPRTEVPDAKLTAGDAVLGTPAFLAPETATGGEVDHRADIYAVGCLLYWLVSGRLVFEAETAVALAVAHASLEATPLGEICEEPIPAELDALVLRCLAKDPAERPQTAGDLACDLAGIPLERPWTLERAVKWWRLHSPTTARAA
jgi:serine/threonine-protein kinase